MENSNRPVQRVTPIRSEYPNRVEANLNLQSSSSLSDFNLCNQNNLINNVNVQQFKINNNPGNSLPNQSSNIIDSLPFLQQNVNIMNINIPNNAIIQSVPQDSISIQNSNFTQPLSNQKTLIQLSDGRFVQFAQNLQQTAQQMPTTILLQMPYKVFDQNLQKSNQNAIAPQIDQITQQHLITDYQQRNIKDQLNNVTFDQKVVSNHSSTIIHVEKYQEICDLLQNKKLLTKPCSNEETVLVEFRLNQQKYQLRMTRAQKVEMEKILVSVGNQQRQMEILQVYQAEQRKMMQQRTSVMLNQMTNKTTANILCNKSQIPGINIAKQVYPINSVLLAVPQNTYGEPAFVQASNSITQSKNIAIQPSASPNTNGILLTTRIPTSQQPTMLSSRDSNKDGLNRQKRNFRTPTTASSISSPNREFLPNANANNEMKPARSRRYNNMRKVLLDDHSAVLTPDCSKPFTDINDVAQRLLPYHILEESKDQRICEVDRILQNTFNEFDKKCANLKKITSALSMNQLLCDRNPESLIVKRMRLDLERDVFEYEKLSYVNSDDTLLVTPLQFDEHGNGLPISIEPPSPPLSSVMEVVGTSFDENSFVPSPRLDKNLLSGENLVPSSSSNAGHTFADSVEDMGTPLELSGDTLQDSVCNYDIQDISIDSIDSPISEPDWNMMPDKDDPLVDEVVHNSQSEDPDLDAAIKSILF